MSETSDQSLFEQELETVHQQYLRRDLEDRLEKVATEMEETMLQAIIARDFLDLEVKVVDEAKEKVQEAGGYADERDFDALDDIIDNVEDQVSQEAHQIENKIHEERTEERDRVRAMRKLNEHVEAADMGKLNALESLLDDWNWKAQVYTDEAEESFEAKQQEARDVAATMSNALQQVQKDLLGSYSGTTLEDVMDQLLSDEPPCFNDLSEEEREALTGSNLANYLEIRLG
ncbi:hypothetical protein L593_06110 [Salinarchaeum sp. Harcht-Bsk1]|uniref:hypothetical protein n=1 Tax=Salinarchaeum sp. Harcht-Bsk1 TaxID=1333523 RepID=UPI0003423CBD|nr:hypothetical protein [Salinarchaeum sp. Harcht-Bsk1]AGN01171.1 hypothetical protein L593_06110 [Salinarchaeum sp. Harcht-Bsk1]